MCATYSKASLSHLHDLVSLFHSLVVGRAVWLNSTYKDTDIVAPHEPQTHTALLRKCHCVHV